MIIVYLFIAIFVAGAVAALLPRSGRDHYPPDTQP